MGLGSLGGPDSSAIGVPQAQEGDLGRENPLAASPPR